MHTHFDSLETQLQQTGGPWILGDTFSLADVSWLVIFERLRQADSLHVFSSSDKRPACAAYWARLIERPSYRQAILEQSHPLIDYGTRRIRQAKVESEKVRSLLEGA
jgi:glutathione S-transferase